MIQSYTLPINREYGTSWEEFVLKADHLAALKAAVKEKDLIYRNTLSQYNQVCFELGELREQIAALKAEINNPKRTYCAYCGFVVEIDDEGASKIGEHIAICEKHPMRQLEEQIVALTTLIGEKEIRISELERDYEDASGRIVALTASLINYFTAAEFENVEEMISTKPPEFYRMMGQVVAEKTKELYALTAENERLREALEKIMQYEAAGPKRIAQDALREAKTP